MRKAISLYIQILLAILLTSCGEANHKENVSQMQEVQKDPQPIIKVVDKNEELQVNEENGAADIAVDENATYFIVFADTGKDYSVLDQNMYRLSKALHLTIDTLGRAFDKSKNLIALPEDDEDEIYAGDYFPRRYPSEDLSVEYLIFYKKQAGEKTMAVVTGIYETEKSADSALAILKVVEKNGFKLKCDIYIGCMH